MRVLLLCILAISAVSAVTPFMDIWEEIDDAKCTLQSFTDIVLRVYKSTGAVEPNFAKNVKLLADTGLKYELSAYIAPCLTCEVATQAKEILAAIKGIALKMVWVSVEGRWNPDRQKNKQFLTELLAELTKGGVTAGIHTDMWSWQFIMGREVHDFADRKLWYTNHNGRQDSNDFRPFAGWTTPNAKQYQGAAELCGDTINKDIYFP